MLSLWLFPDISSLYYQFKNKIKLYNKKKSRGYKEKEKERKKKIHSFIHKLAHKANKNTCSIQSPTATQIIDKSWQICILY